MDLHRALEKRVADFLDKEDAVIFNMGYATNSTSINALIGKVLLLSARTRCTNNNLTLPLLGWSDY
jgi:7-keto-8-aminopelargonate synthetase-like enzyme